MTHFFRKCQNPHPSPDPLPFPPGASSSSRPPGAVVAQLASARLSEREVPGSILGDLNVCFDFPLIRVAIALNTRKTEH